MPSVANVPSLEMSVVPSNTGELRQWLCFPESASASSNGTSSARPFCLLVESACGRLAIAGVSLRQAPDRRFASLLASLIDERPLAMASRERLAGEFGERHGITLDLLDLDLDTDSPAEWPSIVARAIAQAVIASPIGDRRGTSLSEVKAAATKELKAQWDAAAATFIRNLDSRVVAAARSVARFRPSAYNYLCSPASIQPREESVAIKIGRTRQAAATASEAPGELHRNRTQALVAFPFLQSLITRFEFESIRLAVDQGGKLVDALASHYGVTRGAIRGLRGVSAGDLGRWTPNLGVVLKILGNVPPDWWPRDVETWRKLIGAINAIMRTSRRPITTSTNLLWLRQSIENGYALANKAPEELERIGQDIDEFIDSLRRALYFAISTGPGGVVSAPGRRTMEIASRFRAEVGLLRLADIARRFGDAYRRASMRLQEEAEVLRGVRWPAIGDSVATYGDIVFVPLLRPAELTLEGMRMCNCVGTYASACSTGKSQIWSLRRKDGTSVATLETRIRRTSGASNEVVIAQISGHRNAPAPVVVQEAAGLHVVCLTKDHIAVRRYLDWKVAVSGKPLGLRQRHALMLPIIAAMESALEGKWAWANLLAMCAVEPRFL